jgi:hypothetical protein
MNHYSFERINEAVAKYLTQKIALVAVPTVFTSKSSVFFSDTTCFV